MKLPNFKRLNKNDYPDAFQEIVDTLASSLNIGIESLYQALNKQLTRRENMLATEKDITLSVTSSGIPTTSTFFTLDFTGKALGLSVEKIDNLSNPNALLQGGVSVLWSQTGNTIVIQQVTGLIPSNQYRLHVVANG